MGFLRYANAVTTRSDTSLGVWHQGVRVGDALGSNVRTATTHVPKNLLEQASDILSDAFSPANYLLSHATIVASVDTVEVPNWKTAASPNMYGFSPNRKFANFRVDPKCDQWINNNCFTPGTLITMADGTVKSIEDVEVGDEVVTHLGRRRKVTHTFRRDIQGEIYELNPRGTTERTYATGEHPFFVFRPNHSCANCGTAVYRKLGAISHLLGKFYCGSKCYQELRRTNRELLAEKRGEFVETKDLSSRDYTAVPVDRSTQDVDLTLGQARLIGLFAAEGYYELYGFNDNDNERVGAVWALHQDETGTLAKDIVELLKSEFGVEGVIREHADDNGIHVTTRTNRDLAGFFSHWVRGEGAKTKTLHPDLMRAPFDIQMEVVRGWFEGDGSFLETESDLRLVGSTACRSLANQMQMVLRRLGVSSRLCRSEQEGRKRLVIDGEVRVVSDPTKKHVGWHVSCGGGWIPELVRETVYEHQYFTCVEERGGIQNAPDLRFLNGYHLQMLGDMQVLDYEGPVYNIEVDQDHSYVANGMAVHNCDAWDRPVLAMSYPTFIGGYNFVEHVQIPEQSKGRIVDAVARDIGDSLYVDILIATNRKHRQLIAAIEQGRMSTLSMGCFLAGTQVTMADGRRVAIEDIVPGDMVISHKGVPREVLNKQHRKGVWSTRKIKAVGVPSTIKATDNHPFFVLRPRETCACGCGESLHARKSKDPVRRMGKRFKRGHRARILNPNGTYSLEELRRRQSQLEDIERQQEVEEVRADELRVGDYLCFPRTEFASVGVDASTGRARLLGYFLAEGSFLKRKGEPVEVQFNFSMEERNTYVQEVVELLQEEFPGCSPWTQDRSDRNTCAVHVCGRDIAKWFLDHGGEYSNRKVLSPEVMAWSTECQKHLLGCWLSGDGTLWNHAHRQTSGTTTSYDLACQLHALSMRCGLFVRLECSVKGRAREVQEVMNGGVVVRDEDTGKLPAFRLVFGQTVAKELSSYTDKAPGNSHFDKRHLRVLDDIVIFPITSIEEDDHQGWVYDMEVEEDHSYLVEGVAVHNCSIDFSICTKCGNVAVDEPGMCHCIRHGNKGSIFFDELGQRHRVAELCGHKTAGETGGVRFIEASWVAVAAFQGAVLRNILVPEDLTPDNLKRAVDLISSPPKSWSPESLRGFVKAATLVEAYRTAQFDFGGPDEDEGGGSGGEKDFFGDLVDDVKDEVGRRTVKRIREEMEGTGSEEAESARKTTEEDDNLVRQAVLRVQSQQREFTGRVYRASINAVRQMAPSDIALVNGVASINNAFGVTVPVDVYRAALRVGPTNRYPNVGTYVQACGQSMRRSPTECESRTLVRLGNMLAHWAAEQRSTS